MASVSVYVMLVMSSLMAPAVKEFPVLLTLTEMLMDHVLAIQDSPTIPVSALDALKVPSGVHQSTGVFLSADKILPTLPQLMLVSATLASDSFPDHARPVPLDTLFPTDTV